MKVKIIQVDNTCWYKHLKDQIFEVTAEHHGSYDIDYQGLKYPDNNIPKYAVEPIFDSIVESAAFKLLHGYPLTKEEHEAAYEKSSNLTCNTCNHYGLYQMITSGKTFGYSGDIPCTRCSRFKTLNDEHTSINNFPTVVKFSYCPYCGASIPPNSGHACSSAPHITYPIK